MPPLDNDVEGNGKPSDHLIVEMRPIGELDNPKPKYKTITFRPLPDSGLLQMKQWLQTETWQELYQKETADEKAEHLHSKLLEKLELYLPEKTVKIRPDDRAWVTSEIKSLDRIQKREYRKHKKSGKWKRLNEKYVEKCKRAKEQYSENIVNDLKQSNPAQWYSKIKRMSSHSQTDDDNNMVQELIGQSTQSQAENIANQFAEISNLYSPLQTDDIKLDEIVDDRPPPEINPYLVYCKIISIKKKTSTTVGDIPMKVIKYCAEELSFPLSDLYARAIECGEYPNIYKIEIVTPAPKIYPPQTTKDLRKISGTPNFSKIFEKFLADILIEDMKPTRDPSQYGNSKGVSTQHYLIKMIDRILSVLDKNNKEEANAVIAQLVDWAQAFDRQCPLLGINSFLKNGVRKSVIPVLVSYFQNRKMRVKWRGTLSTVRDLPGGGPQGCSLGLIEYDSQTNENTDFLLEDDKYKFVDDLSILELINLITIGLSSYNFYQHVASDIGIDQSYIPSENLQSQNYADKICQWTEQNKMKLNEKKCKVMIFNRTRNYQFSTRVHINNTILETISETQLLGTVITSDLTWNKNTQHLTQKGFQRMTILRKLYEFNIPREDLVQIYCMYIRSVVEFNSCVWFSSITQEQKNNIERVQRIACMIIMKNDYVNYENALEKLNLQTLSDRRDMLASRFANKCTNNDRFKDLFPTTEHGLNLRKKEKFKVKFASTQKLYKSSIPSMQRLLNKENK